MFFPGRGMPRGMGMGMNPGPMMGPSMPTQAMNRSGGGFLSKLLSGFKGGSAAPTGMMPGAMNPTNFMGGPGSFMGAGFNAANAANVATSASGAANAASTLKGLTNPANLGAILGNVQKALHTAESVMPMVQQYGPLVKNIPSMIKLYRELNSSNSEEDTSTEEKQTEKKKSRPENTAEAHAEDDGRDVPKTTTKSSTTKTGQSVPRLYI
ncbi:VrrA/YqfQ family protein [Bacillus sp. PS06]|uniref:VrrA/YqfQ family protein n=1 Tax=Bacillus sp. PS06 TaxID=2764176 RepID=UPI001784C830|nr:VrrA/YqfQ family protein [Bacillus sp. PS06]MBD8069172.1 hypothetical protein [Bacillus sp. PS06]